MAFLPEAGPPRRKAPGRPLPAPPLTSPAWQRDMQGAFRSLEPLLRHLGLDPAWRSRTAPVRSRLPPARDQELRGPDGQGGLVRSAAPAGAARRPPRRPPPPGFRDDAVGDLPSQVVPGLLHKYASRALLMVCSAMRHPLPLLLPPGIPLRGSSPGAGGMGRGLGIPGIRRGRGRNRLQRRRSPLPRRPPPGPHPVAGAGPAPHPHLALPYPAARGAALARGRRASCPSCGRRGGQDRGGGGARQPSRRDRRRLPAALEALRGTGALLLNQAVLLKGINDEAGALAELSRRLHPARRPPLLPPPARPRHRHGPFRGGRSPRAGPDGGAAGGNFPVTPCPATSARWRASPTSAPCPDSPGRKRPRGAARRTPCAGDGR